MTALIYFLLPTPSTISLPCIHWPRIHLSSTVDLQASVWTPKVIRIHIKEIFMGKFTRVKKKMSFFTWGSPRHFYEKTFSLESITPEDSFIHHRIPIPSFICLDNTQQVFIEWMNEIISPHEQWLRRPPSPLSSSGNWIFAKAWVIACFLPSHQQNKIKNILGVPG